MDLVLIVVLLLIIVGGGYYLMRSQQETKRKRVDDAKAEARRWLERLGGQVLNLTGTDTASQQALADASERYTAAGSQMEQAETEEQAKLVKETALEGLYYVRAAREAMGMDPGPALPRGRARQGAGRARDRGAGDAGGRRYAAPPQRGADTPQHAPGGRVAGRPVPQGWYSEPWWKPALVAGAWGLGSMMLFSAMFSGM